MVFREAATTCLSCGTPMTRSETATGHAIEICDGCGGAWMEVAAFLADLRDAQPGRAVDELLEHNDGTPRRPCPRCGEKMAIAWLEFLQLDQCAAHGVWFDRGELDRALRGDVVPPVVAAVLRRAEQQAKKARRS
jgi:Zn-finger nucleic acid-binding protein